MPFHSPAFLLLCLLTFGLYYLGGARWQHFVLLASSLVFYYYAGIVDTAVLVGAIGINHLVARWVEQRSRVALAAIVTANLSILGYFKYRAMFVLWANDLFGTGAGEPSLVIPLGISFYIFQMIAYQVDLYRGQLEREKSFLRTLLYILFFPHHQAGPIMRPAKFLPQFYGRKDFVAESVALGGLWIAWGLAKKILADNFASGVDRGFENYADIKSAAAAWSLALRYAIQIYGDFSGYSDIAVGLGLLFGYRLDRNFDQPYLARDPSEFWRRWHITLSAWLRDYLYIPLGGSRKGEARTLLNLMITMVLGGLWHGASAMFILWGFLHGALLVIHKLFPALFRVAPIGWAITFGFTVVAWVPFRATSWASAQHLLAAMFGFFGVGSVRDLALVAILIAAILVSQLAEDRVTHTEETRITWLDRWLRVPALVRGVALAGGVLVMIAFVVDHTTYIYFRF
jgi:alginate O-acetyltransferase complex protein AlgI